MVGGTKLPPQDSVSEPWGNEQSKEKTKPFHEGKKQNLRPLVVSLDNADMVIEGGPPAPEAMMIDPASGFGRYLLLKQAFEVPGTVENTDDLNSVLDRQVENEMFGEPFQQKRPDTTEGPAMELVDLAYVGPVSE